MYLLRQFPGRRENEAGAVSAPVLLALLAGSFFASGPDENAEETEAEGEGFSGPCGRNGQRGLS